MKIGVSLKIDVKRNRLKLDCYAAQSGASYLDLTMFLDTDNVGQYGDHGNYHSINNKRRTMSGIHSKPIIRER